MPNTPELSEARRALLERYLRGDIPQVTTAVGATNQQVSQITAPQSSAVPRVPVVALQTGGLKRPFFYLHVHEEGGAFYCFTLTHVLGPDQPFYILDPYRFDDPASLPSLEVMAAAYIDAMRAIQSEGPYLIGGFCGGGLIAYEMAQQLHAVGQKFDLLLLIEPVDGPAPLKYIVPRLTSHLVRGIGTLLRLSQGQQLDWFLYLRHVPRLLRHSHYWNLPGFSLFPTAQALRQEWLSLFVWVISAYTPRHYPGKVTYLWACEKPEKFRAGWGTMARAEAIEIYVTRGDHTTCRTKYIHEMAGQLRQCLNKLHESTPCE